MSIKNELRVLTMKELLGSGSYIIPVYQRNYAWGVAELEQLIQDIADYAVKGMEQRYYIGTLVVFQRGNGDETKYETIDGQQRLTTLNILLCAIRHEMVVEQTDLSWFERVNISFDYREKSNNTLHVMFRHEQDNQDSKEFNPAMWEVYDNCAKKLKSILSNNGLSLHIFLDYFLNKVCILRVSVPQDTKLNHYFEIMNSRGIQLEKHEVLKAKLLDLIKYDKPLSLLFSKIWNACSNMERYVQMGFGKETNERDIIFSKDWNRFKWIDIDSIMEALHENGKGQKDKFAQVEEFSIRDIIDGKQVNSIDAEVNICGEYERFTPIISFPNFLLHVLRIQTCEDIALDDKRLIEEFDCILKGYNSSDDRRMFVKQFIFNLLKLKFLTDQYVIKREYLQHGDQWCLKQMKYYDRGTFSYINIFEDDLHNKELIMIQSMFHVSAPTQIYKHWLNATLHYLYDNYRVDAKLSNNPVDAELFIRYLNGLSRAYMCDRYLCGDLNKVEYYNIIYKNNGMPLNVAESLNFALLNQGTDVENFVFNYLDYNLWKSDKSRWKDFEFTFRSSVEHYSPQHPIEGTPLPEKILNNWGNLCLISNHKNSRLSNHSPIAKLDYYQKNSTIESIKQRIMMDIVREKQSWTEREIMEHGVEMARVIKDSLC